MVTLRLPEDLLNEIKNIASLRGETLSKFTRDLITQAASQHMKEKNNKEKL